MAWISLEIQQPVGSADSLSLVPKSPRRGSSEPRNPVWGGVAKKPDGAAVAEKLANEAERIFGNSAVDRKRGRAAAATALEVGSRSHRLLTNSPRGGRAYARHT